MERLRITRRREKLRRLANVNESRCQALPIYGVDLVSSLRLHDECSNEDWRWTGRLHCLNAIKKDPKLFWTQCEALSNAILSVEDRVAQMSELFSRYACLHFIREENDCLICLRMI